MNKQEIQDIVSGLVETVGSRDLSLVLGELNISLETVDHLAGDYACYLKGYGHETIFISSTCPPELKNFRVAHEIGHRVLHDGCLHTYSPIGTHKTSMELEADLFRFYLLGVHIELVDGFTISDYASLLGVSEKVIEYLLLEK